MEASFPDPGATNVPTNAVLFVGGPELAAQSIVLRDSESLPVAVTLRSVERGFDILPSELLAVDSSYTIEVDGAPPIAFSTGGGAVSAPDEVATPELRLKQVTFPAGTCGQLANTCARATTAPDTYIELRTELGFLTASLVDMQTLMLPYGQAIGDCVTAQARHVTGLRSATIEICGDDIPLRTIAAQNGVVFPQNVCDDTVTTSAHPADSRSCSVAGRSNSKEATSLGLLALAFAASAARRSARKKSTAR